MKLELKHIWVNSMLYLCFSKIWSRNLKCLRWPYKSRTTVLFKVVTTSSSAFDLFFIHFIIYFYRFYVVYYIFFQVLFGVYWIFSIFMDMCQIYYFLSILYKGNVANFFSRQTFNFCLYFNLTFIFSSSGQRPSELLPLLIVCR